MILRDPFIWTALLLFLIIGLAKDVDAHEEVEYCYDRTTYPPRVVVIPAGTQCPPGYYK